MFISTTARLSFTAALLLTLQLIVVKSSYQNLYSSFKRAATVAFNSLALSSCLMNSVYVPDADAIQGSKLESLYHIKKPMPFKDSKEIYQDLVAGGDKDALYNLNRYLIDYTFGTITTMFYDPQGVKFHDDLAWRSKLRRIEENGDKIYSSQFETNRVIENLVRGLDDEYTYYRSPDNYERHEKDDIDLGCARDCVRIPLLGFELRVFQTFQPLSTAEIENNNKYLITKKITSLDKKEILTTNNEKSIIYEDKESAKTDLVGRWVAVVNKIYPTSPAERAGLRVGDQLLDCNRVLISELLNTPKPVFTPKRGLLDTDEQISRIIQDDSASFYRTKLRALISGKTDSVFTDFADNIESQIRNFKNEKNDRNDKKGDSDRKKSNFALIQRNNKSVRFSIVRSQRIPSTPSDMSGTPTLIAEDRVYHLSLTPDTPGPSFSGPNMNQKRTDTSTVENKKVNFLTKLTANINNNNNNDNRNRGKKDETDTRSVQDFSDNTKVRVSLEELHNGGRTFLLGPNSDNALAKNLLDFVDKRDDMKSNNNIISSSSSNNNNNINIISSSGISSDRRNYHNDGNLLSGKDDKLVASSSSSSSPSSSSSSSLSSNPSTTFSTTISSSIPATTSPSSPIDNNDEDEDDGNTNRDSERDKDRDRDSDGNLISYIRMTAFDRIGSKVLVEILDDQMAKGTSLVVLDLRNNYGGVIQDAMLDASLFLDKPSDVICYTVSPRGVGTHDVDEWLASWSPRVEMEKKSKYHRLQKEKEIEKENKKLGLSVKKSEIGYYRNENRFIPRSYLAKNTPSVNKDGEDSFNVEQSLIKSGSELRAEIKEKETLGFIKSALVPSRVPVAILTNGGTASAAEVFTAALQENGRATVIGTKTFGKSLIQHDFPLPNGGTLHMSVAEYLTPKKNYLTHDVIAFSEQSSNYFDSGQRSKMISTPFLSLPSSTSEPLIPSSSPLSSFSISSSDFIASSVSSPTSVFISTAAASLHSSSSSSPPSSSSISLASLDQITTTTNTDTNTDINSDTDTNTNTVPRAKDRAKAREKEREKELERAASLPDSTYVFDDDIEEISYGGIRPDVWCDDEPATQANRDLCTMEVISLLL